MQKLKVCLIVVISFLPAFICASGQTVIINEICWMGNASSSNDEWIELFNNSEQEINLDGWVLKSADDGIKINLKGEIPSKGFFLLERTDDNSAPNAKADLIYSGALSNNGENLFLIDNLGNIIDQADFAEKWLFGDNKTKQTMERNPSTGSGQVSWQTSQNPGGTPKQPNSQCANSPNLNTEVEMSPKQIPVIPASASVLTIATTSQSDTRSDDRPMLYQIGNVFINEIMPSPEGSDSENEWVEIFNASNFEADVSGWKIRDKIGAVKIYTFPENRKIEANGFLILKRPQTKISLNNEADGLELLNPSGQIIDGVDYEKATQDQSWSKIENTWQWTAKPTPGAANVIVSIKTSAAPSFSAATSTQEKQLLVNIQNYPSGRKNFLAVGIAIAIATGSAFTAWQIKKKSIEI
ncbi:MAG: lamin tail domain-containing protein [Candidatus Pacebacteria bacterium]|nr:lamin tail domain-containing protein [Candidatus Paceibacterota bacterium]